MPLQCCRAAGLGITGVVLLFSSWPGPTAAPADHLDTVAAEGAIQAEVLLEHVRVLTAPEMEGRAAGTPGGDRAAPYIAAEFRQLGLQPLGADGNYLQTFAITTEVRLGEGNRLALEFAGARKRYEVGTAFQPFGFSAEGSVRAEIAFVGYGITAPELSYDDDAGLDVQGKIVLVMTHEPRSSCSSPVPMPITIAPRIRLTRSMPRACRWCSSWSSRQPPPWRNGAKRSPL